MPYYVVTMRAVYFYTFLDSARPTITINMHNISFLILSVTAMCVCVCSEDLLDLILLSSISVLWRWLWKKNKCYFFSFLNEIAAREHTSSVAHLAQALRRQRVLKRGFVETELRFVRSIKTVSGIIKIYRDKFYDSQHTRFCGNESY